MWGEWSFSSMVSEPSLARAPQIPGSSTKHSWNNDKLFYIFLKVPFDLHHTFLQAIRIISGSTSESSFVKVLLVSSILWNNVLIFFSISLSFLFLNSATIVRKGYNNPYSIFLAYSKNSKGPIGVHSHSFSDFFPTGEMDYSFYYIFKVV